MRHHAHTVAATAAALALACGTASAPAPALTSRADAATSGAARSHHTATLLTDGRLLVAGGRGGGSAALASVELWDLGGGTVVTGAPLTGARSDHSATLLADGRVLVGGGTDAAGAPVATTELFDPITGLWTPGPALAMARARHTATRLASGEVLLAGGQGASGPLPGAERLSADTAAWSDAGPLSAARASHAAVLLADGTVLALGGDGGAGPMASAERYDPVAGAWSPADSLAEARADHVAVRLADGSVLAAGGEGTAGTLASAERWDSAAGTWSLTGPLGAPHADAAAVLLPSGRVVVAGGRDGAAAVAAVELYDPASGTFSTGAPLAEARAGHSATLLPSGQVHVAGGEQAGSALVASERLDLTAPAWAVTSPTSSSRRGHTATLLPGGKVLVAGGLDGFGGYLANAQLYDPATGLWTDTGSMLAARTDHSATLLESGEVLVTGGAVGSGTPLAAAEVYDPLSGTWTATGALLLPRTGHTATLLPSGAVLVAGGEQLVLGAPAVTRAVELYDPAAGVFVAAASMVVPRARHTASLLPGGDVLLAGGQDAAGGPLGSCERWSSAEWGWRPAPSLVQARAHHAATVLEGGRVLVTGGNGTAGPTGATELFDPAQGWTAGPALAAARTEHAAALLPSGAVLVAGGRAGGELASAERWDPWLGAWAAAPALTRTRTGLTLTLLPDGRALATGGDAGDLVHVAEVYDAGLGADPALLPVLDGDLPERTPGSPLALTGAGLAGGAEASGGGPRASAVNHPVLRLEGAGPVTHLTVVGFGQAAVAAAVPMGVVPGWYWVRPQVAGAGGTARSLLVLGTLRITPPSAGVAPLGALSFSAAGGIAYTWSLDANGSGGTIDAGTGAYRAGPVGGVTDVVRVTDALGYTATAAVAVGPALAIGANPGGADPGGTIGFTASGGSRTGYAWSIVTGGSGSTLDPVTGLYTAGDQRNSADLVRVTDSLGNVAEVIVYVWPEWKLGGEGCNCGTGGLGASPLALLLASLAARRLRRRRVPAHRLVAALVLGALAAPALAQEYATSIVVERFEPLGGARDVLSVGSPDLPGHLERSAGLALSFASRPLRLAAPGALSYAMVSSQATLAVGASVGLFGVAELAVVGSGSLAQSSERAPNVPQGLQPSIAGSGFSDVRVIPKLRLGALGPLHAALAVPVTIPTGRTDSFLGAGGYTYAPRLLLSVEAAGVRVLGSAGYVVRPHRALLDATIGNAITYGLAGELPFQLAGKSFAALASVAGEKGQTSAASPLEALLGLRWNGPRGIGVTVGGGPGISSGYGTPDWRAFAAVSLSSLPAVRLEPPAAAEPPPVLVAAAEEPPPPEPAPAPAARARRTPVAVPLPPPPVMQVDARVYFGVNESAIPARAYPELEKVAAAILANPKPVKLVVEGHADEIGATRHNRELSEQRAERVKSVLKQAGIPADRLRSVGYGDSRPAMPGRHAMNRRVELKVE